MYIVWLCYMCMVQAYVVCTSEEPCGEKFNVIPFIQSFVIRIVHNNQSISIAIKNSATCQQITPNILTPTPVRDSGGYQNEDTCDDIKSVNNINSKITTIKESVTVLKIMFKCTYL